MERQTADLETSDSNAVLRNDKELQHSAEALL